MKFYCVQGRQAPSAQYGWQSRVDALYFPRPEVHEGGRTVTYRLRKITSDGVLLSGADCVVPYTEAALRRVDRLFRITDNGGADQFKAPKGTVSIQGCVSDDLCMLDLIIVVAPPPAPSDFPPCSGCDAPFPSIPTGGGDGDTGGSAYEQGPMLWAACIGAGLAAIGAGTLSYVAVEQYYMSVSAYGSARLRYEYSPTWENYSAMLTAQKNVDLMAIALAGSVGITVGSLLIVVAACSPSVLAPTP